MRDPLTAEFLERGWAVLPASPAMRAWAEIARGIAEELLEDPAHNTWYRHDRTWFAGVDVLPNDPDGALGPVALAGPALTVLGALGYPVTDWHAGQMSAVFPGYPGRDAGETDASAGFRRNRDAAHVDGLLPIGPDRRRMLREPHAFILGIPLTEADKGASPLAVWEGSHRSIGAALCAALEPVAEKDRADVDLTDIYHAARKAAFDAHPRRLISAEPGAAFILHRHMLHGISPWTAMSDAPRLVAYFRPQFSLQDWINAP